MLMSLLSTEKGKADALEAQLQAQQDQAQETAAKEAEAKKLEDAGQRGAEKAMEGLIAACAGQQVAPQMQSASSGSAVAKTTAPAPSAPTMNVLQQSAAPPRQGFLENVRTLGRMIVGR